MIECERLYSNLSLDVCITVCRLVSVYMYPRVTIFTILFCMM